MMPKLDRDVAVLNGTNLMIGLESAVIEFGCGNGAAGTSMFRGEQLETVTSKDALERRCDWI
jgi:hypothetical protein